MTTALFDQDLYSSDCIFCGHDHHDAEWCNTTVCGDGCCQCPCGEYLPLEAGPVRQHIAGLNARIAGTDRQVRKLTEELRVMTKRYKAMFEARNREIERRAKAEKKLAKKGRR